MKAEHYTAEGARVVRGQNITDRGRIEGEFVHISDGFADSLGSARLRCGDIALPHRGAIGRAALVTSDDLVMSTSLMRVRIDRARAEPAYIAAFLASPGGEREILQFASTVGTPGIGQPLSSLRKVAIPLPPLSVQRRIAAVLGAFDDLIETNRAAATNLRALALATFDAASRDGAIVPFDEIGMQGRDGIAGDALAPGTAYLGLEHFGQDGVGLIGVGDAGSVDSNKARFGAGDILYGKLRPYFRKFDRPGFDGVCSTEIWVLRPKVGWGAATLNAVVARPNFTDFAMAGNTGTRMPRANWAHVATMPVLVPPADKREHLDDELEALWCAGVDLSDEIADLTGTRDELLPLLISGKVRASAGLVVS